MWARKLIGIGIALSLGAGCKDEDAKKIPFPDGKSTRANNKSVRDGDATAPAAAAPPHPQTADAGTKTPTSSGSGTSSIKFGEFSMDVPLGWTSRSVTNPMRIAEFEWPKAGHDTDGTSLVVFFFGVGGGGTVENNLTRWRSQFVEEGDPSPGTIERISAGDATITLLDKSGIFKLQPKMMSPEFTPKPDWRMLAAIVEIDGGPLYFRATGPADSVAAQRDALIRALKSLRAAKLDRG